MKIAFNLDDFSPLNHRFDLLEKLKERYPNFKVNLFTVPWEIRLSPSTKGTPITDIKYKQWVDEVRQGVETGWLNISIHGLTHAPREFELLSYTEAQKRTIVAQKMFENVGIKINKLWKAPQWLLSVDGKKAIEDLGFKVVEDGYYTWNLKDKFRKETVVIAHGHVQDEYATQNGLDQSFHRLLKIPQDAEWITLEESLWL